MFLYRSPFYCVPILSVVCQSEQVINYLLHFWRSGVPVGGAVVAVVGQEVIVELPEHVQRDPAVRSGDVVVSLAEHGVYAVQSQELTQQLVGHSVDFQQTLQLLTDRQMCVMSIKTSLMWKDDKSSFLTILKRSSGRCYVFVKRVTEHTTMEVRSSLSKRLMASSRDL